MSQRIVTRPHVPQYVDPIVVRAGTELKLNGEVDVWDGHRWLWAAAPDGREGWVPDTLPVSTPSGTVAAQDYSAVELAVSPGDEVTISAGTHGWSWCRCATGEGWVPDRCLKAL
ncbi:MAG: hypothetical protein AAGF45_01015 [Pseudomonadota bacterium]